MSLNRFYRIGRMAILLLTVIGTGCSQVPVSAPDQQPTVGQNNAIPRQVMQTYRDALRYMSKGKYDKAEPLLVDLTKNRPDLSGPFANLGIVYARSERYADAEQSFRQAISISPGDAELYNHLGVLLRHEGKFVEAQSVYQQGLKVQPDNRHLLRNLGILYDLYLGAPHAALTQYEAYQKIAADDKQVNGWIVDLKRQRSIAQATGYSSARGTGQRLQHHCASLTESTANQPHRYGA